MALSSAFGFAAAVPHVTILPSDAMAPQLLLYQAHNLHAVPCLAQLSIACFCALLRSAQPYDQPAPLSFALYAIAPQDFRIEQVFWHFARSSTHMVELLLKSEQMGPWHSYKQLPTDCSAGSSGAAI